MRQHYTGGKQTTLKFWKGIGIGILAEICITILLAVLLTSLTEGQQLWQGVPPAFAAAAVPAAAVIAGSLITIGMAGKRKLAAALLVGGIEFVFLVILHSAFGKGVQGVLRTLLMCTAVPTLVYLVAAGGRSRRKKRGAFRR